MNTDTVIVYPQPDPDHEDEVCDHCGSAEWIDSDGTCRSPECEAERADYAEWLLGLSE